MAVSENDSRPLFPSLYVILDDEVATSSGWALTDLASACLAGGARFIQIRAKHAAGRWLLDTASLVVEQTRAAGAIAIVNDRADIARVSNADGVHVGQDDLSPRAVRTILGDQAIVGLSTHSLEQIDAALSEPISYLAVGPVFGTTTKVTGYDAVGLSRVRIAAERGRSRRLPVVAIGGISLDSVADVVAAGAASVAVISDLLSTGDPEGRVRAYLQRLAAINRV